MRNALGLWIVVALGVYPLTAIGTEVPLSEATQTCLECHAYSHPGIVAGWQASRHAQTTPQAAMQVKGLARKVSSTTVPETLRSVAVGCAECHTLRPEAHADTFDHNEYQVHIVVSPDDCATCHIQERTQFDQNLMAHAYKNLADNTLYQDLQRTIIGVPQWQDHQVRFEPANDQTRAEACYSCHGTQLKVTGSQERETDLGEMVFPVIAGWPNQGVGRVNLDGSRGACSACHTRHTFALETARKPYTCKQCHVGPDVPVYKVYAASKHGKIFATLHADWDFKPVPWTIGEDFTAPTCAACHVSLLVNTDGEVVVERTHQMNDRLPWRMFGLVYAHAHPKAPDTTVIRNADGQPLPTDLRGAPATDFLIDAEEQERRRTTLQQTCLNCHDTAWVEGHWQRFENTIAQTNQATRVATDLMQQIWGRGMATGPANGGSLFDEAVEKRWSEIWLFYANSTRFASAMGCGGDYGVFADGRYQLMHAITSLGERLKPSGPQSPPGTKGP
jgi:hypothetical protein